MQQFHLNSSDYSDYPAEEEVLLQDGIQYKVMSVIQKEKDLVDDKRDSFKNEITLITLRNMPDKYRRLCFCARFFKILLK